MPGKPKIEEYKFGKVELDGQTYTEDLIILPDRIIKDWRRDEGHELKPQDLVEVGLSEIDRIIIGTGSSGRMEVTEDAKEYLKNHKVEVETYKTEKACEKFNEAGEKTGTVLHLTC
ncbi:MAG: MTH938/NDUFAF3 family protein [Candidatus Nanohaloarchaeota archaeon QJJ-9]|nr:MTH938/NDUFAF3 family protein [Candidatus Nanohaloarchaeota archaeon QJJ-9]